MSWPKTNIEADHQPMLTESCVDWQGFGEQIAKEPDALLAGEEPVLIFDPKNRKVSGIWKGSHNG